MSQDWLDDALALHTRLAPAVESILQSVLKANLIDYLAITGRTKSRTSALDKITKKVYSDPQAQMTDLSGVRLVLFSESDVTRVASLMDETFLVDKENSLNQSDRLSANQTGYRSIHFVCELGRRRKSLPEFSGLGELKFEIQIRTVLQHAWAEMSHDRNYKFAGKLPRELERRLYLYAGLLEIADKGFDELSRSIDEYSRQVAHEPEKNLDAELDSITIRNFIDSWVANSGLIMDEMFDSDNYSVVLRELEEFGVTTIQELRDIIPDDYVEFHKSNLLEVSGYGMIRDWMIANNWPRFNKDVKRTWSISSTDPYLQFHFPENEFKEIVNLFHTPSGRPAKRRTLLPHIKRTPLS